MSQFHLVFVIALTALVSERRADCILEISTPLLASQHGLLMDPLVGLDDEFGYTPKSADVAFDDVQEITPMLEFSQTSANFQVPFLRWFVRTALFLAIAACWVWKVTSWVMGWSAAEDSKIDECSTSKLAARSCQPIVDFAPFLAATCDMCRWREYLDAIPDSTKVEDALGCTALHIAAHMGYVDMVAELLHRGANVDACDSWDETALHFAARAGNVAVCELLISHGANLNHVSSGDETPLRVAASTGNEDTCNFLFEKGGRVGNVLDHELPKLMSTLLVQRMVLPSKAVPKQRGSVFAPEEVE